MEAQIERQRKEPRLRLLSLSVPWKVADPLCCWHFHMPAFPGCKVFPNCSTLVRRRFALRSKFFSMQR